MPSNSTKLSSNGTETAFQYVCQPYLFTKSLAEIGLTPYMQPSIVLM